MRAAARRPGACSMCMVNRLALANSSVDEHCPRVFQQGDGQERLSLTALLRTAVDLLASTPGIGAVMRNAAFPGVRRIQLNRVNYYVYYRQRTNSDVVEILALWHVRRGAAPRL